MFVIATQHEPLLMKALNSISQLWFSLEAYKKQWSKDAQGCRAVPEELCSRSGWLHSFLRDVMMLSTPSEGSEALPDMSAATDLDLSTCLYTSTCMQLDSL